MNFFKTPIQMYLSYVKEITKPMQMGFTLTKEGKPTGWFARWHKHKFQYANFLHMEDIEFAMGTYVDLYRCRCGAEGINKVRALI